MTVNVHGELFTAGTKISPAMRRSAQKAAAYGLLRVQARSPVATGLLRRSWSVELDGNGALLTNKVPYAIFNEMGTKFMAARPMAAPTIPEIQRVFQLELSREVGRALSTSIVGNTKIDKDANPYLPSEPKDRLTFDLLRTGREFTPSPGGRASQGFKGTGKAPRALSTKKTAEFNREFGRAKPKQTGRLQSPKVEELRREGRLALADV